MCQGDYVINNVLITFVNNTVINTVEKTSKKQKCFLTSKTWVLASKMTIFLNLFYYFDGFASKV